MSPSAPKIDKRSSDEIIRHTEDLAETFSSWRRPAAGQADAGAALIRIFGRMAEILIDRLNHVPDKNFLAYLDLIGARPAPPRAARAPLTFQLATGASAGFVPRGTQVACSPDGGEELIFETERDLVVGGARLVAALVHEPAADSYCDVSAHATGQRPEPFAAFEGVAPIEHSLYIAHDAIFTLPGKKSVTIELTGERDFSPPPVAWEHWDGARWAPLQLESAAGTTKGSLWHVVLSDPPAPAPLTLGGVTARWIRARLQGSPSAVEVPPIVSVVLKADADIGRTDADRGAAGLPPTMAMANDSRLDLQGGGLAFGPGPRPGDALYLLSEGLLSRPGASVVLRVTIGNQPAAFDAQIAWELWNGAAWQALSPLEDTTAALTKTGEITFTVPGWARPAEIGGTPGHWLRARLASGHYGTEPRYEPALDNRTPIRDSAQNALYRRIPGTLNPPLISSILLRGSYGARPPEACLTYNDFVFAPAHTAQSFTPFTAPTERRPALYLGFDAPFPNRPVGLYMQVAPAPYDEAERERALDAPPPRVAWEYAAAPAQPGGPSPWRSLGAEDETRSFAERGLVSFVGPADGARRAAFGHELYWLRAVLQGGAPLRQPLLGRVLTNTVWAGHNVTIRDEILGSSDGSAGQRFTTIRAPALLGQQVSVWEPEPPRGEQHAVAAPADDAGLPGGAWVRWEDVPDFHASGPFDRHYVFDHLAGAVQFGDGQRGRVPPPGRDNIRADRYQVGGGASGNCPAGSVTQLKTTLAYVDAVTNHEPAAGGAAQESLERVKAHGPHRLRHNDRSVAAQDYEDLAQEASPEVARALAIVPRFNPIDLGQDQWVEPDSRGGPTNERAGRVEVIVVPHSAAAQPVPSLELITLVRSHLAARCPPTVELLVAGPAWVAVTITAEVVPASLQGADPLPALVDAALRRFLHPITGGPGGRGWDFGRRPHRSDLYTLLESLPGVEYVHALQVREEPAFDKLASERRERALVYSGVHTISLATPGGGA